MRSNAQPAAMRAAAFPLAAGNDDAATHDLFSAAQRLLGIYQLPMLALFRLVDAIERDGRPVERLSIGELLALVATASEVQA